MKQKKIPKNNWGDLGKKTMELLTKLEIIEAQNGKEIGIRSSKSTNK